MANTIKLKNSGTSSNTPSSLEYGEIAINYADGKLFYKDGGGSISEFANARASVSDTAPSSPSEGDIWFESDTGDVFVYYDSVWVDVGGTSVANIAMSDTAPSSPVNGDFWFETDTGKTFVYYDDGTSQQWIEVGAASAAASGADGAVQFASGGTFSSDDANLHWDDTNNRLGVGTNSPTTALDISQVNPTLTINDTDGVAGGSIASLIQFEANNTVAGEVGFGTGAGNMISWAKDGNYYAGTQSADNVFLRTNNLERLTIDPSGSVGIGTTSPTKPLHIYSATIDQVARFESGDTRGGIEFADSGTTDSVKIGAVGNDLRVRVGSADVLSVTEGGDVGIGITSPDTNLHIQTGRNTMAHFESTDGEALIAFSDNSSTGNWYDRRLGVVGEDMVFITNNTRRLTILDNGNVGIGTTNPTQALQVVGNIESDGLYVGAASQVTVDVSHATYPKIGNYYSSGDNLEVGSYGGIDFVVDSNGNTGEVFVWRSGGTAGAGTRLMELNESGHLGINGYAPDATYSLSADSAIFQNTVMCDSNNNTTPFYVGRYTNTNEAIAISVADRDGYIYMNQDETSGAAYLHLSVNGQSGSTQRIYMDDNLYCGFVSKSSGSFTIDHPIPEMSDTHYLRHSFVEGPQADNLYRGRATLVGGTVSVNIDEAAGMTEGTFVLLNRDIQCWVTNDSGWTAVRGSVSGNILVIEAQDSTCSDSVSWLVMGERQDRHMYDTDWTDDEGHIIVEPEKDDPSIAPRTWLQHQEELANQEAE